MSKLAIGPDASGTGTYTLASPNNNASHTLTLPVATGTLLTSTGDGSGLTALTSANLTGALPAIDGSALTGITGSGGTPTGAVIYHAANSAPTGFIKANGAALSRTTYADLFAVIGIVFGAGDGSTTFNVPDLRGEFLRGWADGGTVDSGRNFGSAQADAYKEHRHTLLGNSGGAVQALFNQSPVIAGIQNLTGSFTDPSSTMGNGNGASTETRPRNIALLACIKF
tara:strand:+ start:929 stop:1606 length:678 start_codon:yes stop_codon:yes gene_type:complete